MTTNGLYLAFGLGFEDLYRRDGLARIDAAFGSYLATSNPDLAARLDAARAAPAQLAPKDDSTLLLALTPFIDTCVGELFGIADEVTELRARHLALAPLYEVKRQFVQRRAVSAFTVSDAAGFDGTALTAAIGARIDALPDSDPMPFEIAFAQVVTRWTSFNTNELHRVSNPNKGLIDGSIIRDPLLLSSMMTSPSK